jgi:hypothetical protein
LRTADRLVWPVGVGFWSYGLKIGIRVNTPGILERVLLRLPPGWRQAALPGVVRLYSLWVGDEDPAEYRLHANEDLVACTRDLEAVLETLESDVQLFVAEWSYERVFVHAGVVGWQGRAVLLPGRSFAGKSTLVAALVRAGASYYSDEYAVLDPQGHVHPYPRRLSLRQEGAQPKRCSAEELGGCSGAGPLPVGLVAITKYRRGGRWQPRSLSPGRAVLELLNHTVPALSRPVLALSTLHQVTPRSANLKGVRGEAEETALALLEQAGR